MTGNDCCAGGISLCTNQWQQWIDHQCVDVGMLEYFYYSSSTCHSCAPGISCLLVCLFFTLSAPFPQLLAHQPSTLCQLSLTQAVHIPFFHFPSISTWLLPVPPTHSLTCSSGSPNKLSDTTHSLPGGFFSTCSKLTAFSHCSFF